MTQRTYAAVNALVGANYGVGNSANVDGVAGPNGAGAAAILASGQNWSNGTVSQPNIKLSLGRALLAINKATLGRLMPQDLTLILTPDMALAMALSPEVQDALKQSQYAMGALTGDEPNVNGFFGLPPRLFGVKVVIEQTIMDQTEKGPAAQTLQYVFPTGSAYLVVRAKDLAQPIMPVNGSKPFSTITMFAVEEFTVERQVDTWNRVVKDAITTYYDMINVAPQGAFQFTRCLG